MAIQNTEHQVEYIITDAESDKREFTFSFPVKSKDDVYCSATLDKTSWSSIINFNVVLSGENGGHVVLAAPVAVGLTLRIFRQTPLTQLKVFRNQSFIPPPEIEDGLDRAVMALQEIDTASASNAVDAVREEIAALDGAIRKETADRAEEDGNIRTEMADGLKTESDTRAAAVDALQSGLDQKAEKTHAAQHAANGSDPVTPASIKALSEGHALEADPHPQYAFRGGDTAADIFFEYDPMTKTLRLRQSVLPDAESAYFTLVRSESGQYFVTMKGSINA